jgi:hypothetical protein
MLRAAAAYHCVEAALILALFPFLHGFLYEESTAARAG